MLTSADSRRRFWGLVFLVLAIGMVTWGQTYLRSTLKGWSFIIYWMGCAGLTCMALFTAVLDILVIRVRGRQEKRRLMDSAFGDLIKEADKSSGSSKEPQAPRVNESPASEEGLDRAR